MFTLQSTRRPSTFTLLMTFITVFVFSAMLWLAIPTTPAMAATLHQQQGVTINYFRAVCEPTRTLLQWETTTENNVLGFNLWRDSSQERSERNASMIPVRINDELIPSESPGGGQGATYEYEDDGAAIAPITTYYLEVVFLDGTSQMHGDPEAVCPSPPTAVTLDVFSAQGNGINVPLTLFAVTGIAFLLAIGMVLRRR